MDYPNKRTAAIILAAGMGTRMKSDTTKQQMSLRGETLLRRSLDAFEDCDAIDDIILVVRPDEIEFAKSEVYCIKKLRDIVVGGNCRAESAARGVAAVGDNVGFVAIHDAARPLITPEMIKMVVTRAHEVGAATAAAKITDTIKFVESGDLIESTIPRDCLMRAQTPQVFELSLYKGALGVYNGPLEQITDDNMLVEMTGNEIAVVDVGDENIKITTMLDLYIAEIILWMRGEENVQYQSRTWL